VALGMRHLVVVDAQNRIVGIVTRKDLDHAAGHGWWRMNAQAPKPKRRPQSRAMGQLNRCGVRAQACCWGVRACGVCVRLRALT
jgi:chloride channel 7